MQPAKSARIGAAIMKGMNVMKKIVIQKIDSKDTISELGNIQVSMISSLYSLSHEVNQEVFVEIVKKVSAIACAFQNAVVLSVIGAPEYEALKEDLKRSLDEFFTIHDEAHARSCKLNNKIKEKIKGAMN